MDEPKSFMTQQIARAASAFQQNRTGRAPETVKVVLDEDTLVIALRDALSPAEMAMARTLAGKAQLQEFHRQLFINSNESLRQEIERITGVEVRDTGAEVSLPSGIVVQVFLLARNVLVDDLNRETIWDNPAEFSDRPSG